jgi:superfamily II DNA/RNA helicase
VETKVSVEKIGKLLSNRDLINTTMRDDQTLKICYNAMQQFGIGTLPILVTTSSAARGLKFPFIGHVINYDLPHTTEFEIHRIAQTGTRVKEKKGEGTVPIPVGPAGKFGRSISFFDPDRQSDRRIAPELVQ